MNLFDIRRVFPKTLVSALFVSAMAVPAMAQTVETVTFPGPVDTGITQLDADGAPILTGVLYTPEGFEDLVEDGALVEGAMPISAVVLMHGCTGIWSNRTVGKTNTDGSPDLQNHIEKWAHELAQSGRVALVVDSYTPRRPTSVPAGQNANTFDSDWQNQCANEKYGGRVNPYTTRVLDARVAYDFLSGFEQIDLGQVGLLGWSQGAQSVLVELADSYRTETFQERPVSDQRFATGVVFYPGCNTNLGFGSKVSEGFWKPYTDVRMNMGTLDGFHSMCTSRFNRATHLLGSGSDIELPYAAYSGAKHSFDGESQSWPTDVCASPATGDVCAMNDADINSFEFFEDRLDAVMP